MNLHDILDRRGTQCGKGRILRVRGRGGEMSLEEQRRRASFDIEALRVIIDEEDGVELKQYVWELLDKDPIFHQPSNDLTIEQEQELTFRRVKRLADYDVEYFVTPAKQAAFLSALTAFDCSLPVLHGINNIVSH